CPSIRCLRSVDIAPPPSRILYTGSTSWWQGVNMTQRTVITNIGCLVSGSIDIAPKRDVSMVIEDGLIASIGDHTPSVAALTVDAHGLSVMPGLVDGHVHPTVGEWTPAQNSTGWVRNYLHGGTTTMISAGELHIPGLPFDQLSPQLVMSIARTSLATIGT